MESLAALFIKVSEDERRRFHPCQIYDKSSFRRALRVIQRTYSKSFLNMGICEVDYSQYEYRWAYIIHHGIFHSQLVHKFLKHSERKLNPWISSLIHKETLKICSLGGGPGVSTLGFLEFLLKSNINLNAKDFEIQVTTVDLDIGWKDTNAAVIENGVSEYLGWNGLPFSTFIQADLTEPLSYSVLEEIRDADVVLMVKLVSALRHDQNGSTNMLQVLFRNMKSGAIVIYVDNNYFPDFHFVQNISARQNMEILNRLPGFSKAYSRGRNIKQACREHFGISPIQSLPSCALILKKKGPVQIRQEGYTPQRDWSIYSSQDDDYSESESSEDDYTYSDSDSSEDEGTYFGSPRYEVGATYSGGRRCEVNNRLSENSRVENDGPFLTALKVIAIGTAAFFMLSNSRPK